MSIQRLIQESINGNPLEMKEALAEELRARIAEALSAKMNEESEELDEISGATLGSYIQKARAQDRAKIDHNKALESDPKVSKLKDKMKDLYGRREYTKSGESKHAKAINKTRDDIESRKKKLDPDYPKSAYPKRYRGVETAIKKLQYGKMTDSYENFDLSDLTLEELEDFMMSEDFEQLDELSRKTLASYVKKASDSAASKGIEYGAKKAQSDEMDRMMNRHMSFSDKDKVRSIMKTTRKDVESPREKAARRLQGIDRAADRLAKD